MKQSNLEIRFQELWSELASDLELLPEFSIPPRKFRFDYWVKDTNVLIEIMGGTYSRVRMAHSSGDGQHRDYEKSRYAQLKGWLVLPFDRKQINEKDIGEVINYVRKQQHGIMPRPLPSVGL